MADASSSTVSAIASWLAGQLLPTLYFIRPSTFHPIVTDPRRSPAPVAHQEPIADDDVAQLRHSSFIFMADSSFPGTTACHGAQCASARAPPNITCEAMIVAEISSTR